MNVNLNNRYFIASLVCFALLTVTAAHTVWMSIQVWIVSALSMELGMLHSLILLAGVTCAFVGIRAKTAIGAKVSR